MNLQYVISIYAMLICLTSYPCKPEHHMSKFMKKECKEARNKNMKEKWDVLAMFFD